MEARAKEIMLFSLSFDRMPGVIPTLLEEEYSVIYQALYKKRRITTHDTPDQQDKLASYAVCACRLARVLNARITCSITEIANEICFRFYDAKYGISMLDIPLLQNLLKEAMTIDFAPKDDENCVLLLSRPIRFDSFSFAPAILH